MGRPRHDKAETARAWEEWKSNEHNIVARPPADNNSTTYIGGGSGPSRSMPGDGARLDATPGSIARTPGLPIGNMVSGVTHSTDLRKYIPVEFQAKNGPWISSTALVCHRAGRRLAGTSIGVSEELYKSLGYELHQFTGSYRPQHKLSNGDIVFAMGTIRLPFKTADGSQVTEHVAVWTRTRHREVPFQVLIDPARVKRFTARTGFPTVGDAPDVGGPSFQDPTPSDEPSYNIGLQSTGPSGDYEGVPESYLETLPLDAVDFAQHSGTANDSQAELDNDGHYCQQYENAPDSLRSVLDMWDDEHAEMGSDNVLAYPAFGASTPMPSFLAADSAQTGYYQDPQLGGAVFCGFTGLQTHGSEAPVNPLQFNQSPQDGSYQPHEPEDEPENEPEN